MVSAGASYLPSVLYNGGRLVSYTAIGGVAGALGSTLSISPAAWAIVVLTAGLFMAAISLQLIGLIRFPARRGLLSPGTLRGFFSRASASRPFVVGLLNGFMPCGPLQAMELYAVGGGSFLGGASSMFLFCIGTTPLTFLRGAASNAFARRFASRMLSAGAAVMMLFAVLMVLRAVNLAGFSPGSVSHGRVAEMGDGVQTFHMELRPDRYESFAVHSAVPLRWIITATAQTLTGCSETILIPGYGVRKKLLPGDNLIEFTPRGKGPISYTCWMGVLTAKITVLSGMTGFAEGLFGADQDAQSETTCKVGAPLAAQDQGNPADIAAAVIQNGIQEVTIRVTDKGYFPAVVVLQKGVKARIRFSLESHTGSDAVVSIPEYRCKLRLTAHGGQTPLLDVSRDFFLFCGIGVLHGAGKVVRNLKSADLEAIRHEMFSAYDFARPFAGGHSSGEN
jgi:sulfite exporter TauE/SafE